jgi:outer membrane protein W
MKKNVFTFVILFILSFNTFSQVKIGLSAGGGFALDSMYAAKVSKIGGAAIMFKYVIANRLSVGINVGINGLDTRQVSTLDLTPSNTYDNNGVQVIVNPDYYTKTKSFTMIPVTFSFEYYFSKKPIKPYAGIDIGFYKFNYSNALIGIKEINVAYLTVGAAPTLGLLIETMPNLELGFNVKYNIVLDNGYGTRNQMFGDHMTSTTNTVDFHAVRVVGDQVSHTAAPMQYLTLNLTMMYKFGKSDLATQVSE